HRHRTAPMSIGPATVLSTATPLVTMRSAGLSTTTVEAPRYQADPDQEDDVTESPVVARQGPGAPRRGASHCGTASRGRRRRPPRDTHGGPHRCREPSERWPGRESRSPPDASAGRG